MRERRGTSLLCPGCEQKTKWPGQRFYLISQASVQPNAGIVWAGVVSGGASCTSPQCRHARYSLWPHDPFLVQPASNVRERTRATFLAGQKGAGCAWLFNSTDLGAADVPRVDVLVEG